jgi:hypothetical protein
MLVSFQDGTVHKYTVEQCSFICDSYIGSNSAHVYQIEFQQKIPGADIPAGSTIHCLINKFKIMGLVLDRKINRKCHILTEGKLDISAVLEHSRRKSLAKLVQEADVLVSSARTVRELLKLCTHKVTHAFIATKRPSCRINFCSWFIQSVNEGALDPQLLFFTAEAWFYLNGDVNMYNK